MDTKMISDIHQESLTRRRDLSHLKKQQQLLMLEEEIARLTAIYERLKASADKGEGKNFLSLI
jgi:hypothetical protein